MTGDYTECRKTHQHLGGKVDGCQEYLEGWAEPYKCLICGCHRNFHVPAVTRCKTEVVYTKCHKIHEFKFQNSVDGCQEFTPKAADDTSPAVICAVCGCHKGFHRNEVTK